MAASSRSGAHFTGVVAALRSEARCLGPRHRSGATETVAGLRVEAGGIGFERAARAAHNLVRAGAGSLLCWGVAGALDPRLRSGDVVLASEVICGAPLALHLEGMRPTALPQNARLRTSEVWRAQLHAQLLHHGPVVEGAILSSGEVICETPLKSRLFRQTAAVAVDMESAAVGVVAQLHDLPFMVLRVIADAAGDELPGILGSVVSAHPAGPPSWVAWLPLLSAPTAWPGLARMGQRYRRACRVLQRCARQGRLLPPETP